MQLRTSTVISRLQDLADVMEKHEGHVNALVLREAAALIAGSISHTLEKLDDARSELRRVESELARGQE